MKASLYYSVFGVLASIMTQAAFAQTAAQENAASAASASTTNRQAESGGIQEIIVTAQRFSESAQKTSLVIEALSGKDLAGVTDIRQLQTVSPGIQLANAGNVTQTYIRGVGSLNATGSQESAVAFNADGVFLFTSTMSSPLLYDLERLEVLKGPQGTLYGRNASGGAINIITRGASLGKAEGYVEGEYGNYDRVRFEGAVNLPLSETLAIRVAAQHAEHDAYFTDGTDDQNLTAGRVRLLWQPSSAVTLRVGVDASDIDSAGTGTSINPNPTNDKFLGALDPRAQTGLVFTGGTSLLSLPPNPPPFFKNKQWSSFAQLDVDTGFATLTVLPAYRYEKINSRSYVPGYEFSEQNRARQKSLEVRLANRSDQLKWVLGAYYFKVKMPASIQPRQEVNFLYAQAYNPTSVESYAFFGEGTYSVTDAVRVIGGLRYTKEKTRSGGTYNALIGNPGIINPITGAPNVQTAAYNPFNPVSNPAGELLDYPIHGRSDDNAVTWKVGAEADLSPDSMLFATASRGFKGGGTYVDVPGVDTAFKPEYLTAFELGSRNRFLDNTLQINVELFYWKLKNQQVPFVGFNSIGQVTFVTYNAGKAHMYGADVDVVWKPSPNDTFHASVEYLKSEYDSFVRTVPSLAVLTSTRCSYSGYAGPFSLAPVTMDCSGMPTLRSPKWSGSASYEHRFDLGNGSDITFDVNGLFASSRYFEPGYTPLFRQKSSAVFNASLSFNGRDQAFSLTGWIKNIANKRIITGGAQLVDFYSRPTLLPPRTYGVSARYNF